MQAEHGLIYPVQKTCSSSRESCMPRHGLIRLLGQRKRQLDWA
jgi:hypothetical protein